jgi:hypothetical protein
MEGGPDPDNRRTFRWDESGWNLEVLEKYRELTAMRNRDIRLRRGSFRILRDDALFIYERRYENGALRFLMNNTDRAHTYDFHLEEGYENARGTVEAFECVVIEMTAR